MAGPSAIEQLFLELANRARAAPAAEAAALVPGTAANGPLAEALAFFGTDLDLFTAELAAMPPAPPLAWNAALGAAAAAHSRAMIAADTQAHRLPGEADLVTRITAKGYEAPTVLAENVFAFAEDAVHGHAAFVVNWGEGTGGMQDPRGHRETLLNAEFAEIGVGVLRDRDPGTAVGPLVVTQNLGTRADAPAALTGVLTSDRDGDAFYDIGEGLARVTVTATGSAGTFSTETHASGGYTLELPPGAYTVTFSGGELVGSVTRAAEIGADNVKLDARYLDAVGPGALLGTRQADAGPGALAGTPGNDAIHALEGDDLIRASAGDDLVSGGKGTDTYALDATLDAVTRALLDDGTLRIDGPAGADTLAGIERVDLADRDILLDIGGDDLGFAYRVYSAAFGRLPGEDGLRFWTDRLEDGMPREAVAGEFARSEEFAARFGADPTDEAFVTALYNNVLGRDPGPDGFDFWLGVFRSGALDRADMLIRFAESPENVAATAPNLSDGVVVLDAPDELIA